MKKDTEFINYWNRRVREEKREENIGWIIVTAVWAVGYIVFYALLK